jgi:putative ABC transport system permease protein
MMFLIEAFTLSALAAALGVVLGLGLSGALHAAHLHVPVGLRLFLMASTFKFAVEPSRIALGVGVITACTTGIALIPSYLAARLKPITAMQHN